MFKFKVLTGSFVHDGRQYRRNDIVETCVELDKIFKNAFERLESPTPPKSIPPPVIPTAAPPAEAPVGVDVTANFKGAKEANVQVREVNGAYFVYDVEHLGEALNPAPLQKSKVLSFIRTLG